MTVDFSTWKTNAGPIKPHLPVPHAGPNGNRPAHGAHHLEPSLTLEALKHQRGVGATKAKAI